MPAISSPQPGFGYTPPGRPRAPSIFARPRHTTTRSGGWDSEVWSQVYDPLGNTVLSTLVCAIPVLVLLGGLGIFQIRAHYAAIAGLVAAAALALLLLGMPDKVAAGAAMFGALFALTTICWIIVNLIFLYRMTVKSGLFQVLRGQHRRHHQRQTAAADPDRLLLGAFFEGAAGGGTGTESERVTENTDEYLSGDGGTAAPFGDGHFDCGVGDPRRAGLSFAIPQLLIANYHGPHCSVDMVSAMVSIVVLAIFSLLEAEACDAGGDATGSGASVSYQEAQHGARPGDGRRGFNDGHLGALGAPSVENQVLQLAAPSGNGGPVWVIPGARAPAVDDHTRRGCGVEVGGLCPRPDSVSWPRSSAADHGLSREGDGGMWLETVGIMKFSIITIIAMLAL